MKYLLPIILFFGFSFHLAAQPADYNFSLKIPDVPQNLCDGSGAGIAIYLNDQGTNGQPTYYQFFSPDGINLTGPVTGFINNNTATFVACVAQPSGFPVGSYTIFVQASYDPTFTAGVITDFFIINIIDEPVASIQTPNGDLICDGSNVVLVADAGGAYNPSYSWNTGATTSSINVTTQGPYAVTVSNTCGSDNASLVVDGGFTPTMTSFTCANANNEADLSVSASNPGNLPLTYQWMENGNPISDGGDFSITNGMNTSTLKVVNVSQNHQNSIFTCQVYNDCGDFVTPGCLTLPVELLYFSGDVLSEGIQLKWATATETNSEAFYVQRSYDARNFETIGELPAAGFSQSELVYEFLDKTVDKSIDQVYYRLKQVDFDGTTNFSEIVSVRMDGDGSFQLESVYALGQEVSLRFFAPDQGEITATIFDLSGRILFENKFLAAEGYNQQSLTGVDIPSGFYVLQLHNGFRTAVQKFVR